MGKSKSILEEYRERLPKYIDTNSRNCGEAMGILCTILDERLERIQNSQQIENEITANDEPDDRPCYHIEIDGVCVCRFSEPTHMVRCQFYSRKEADKECRIYSKIRENTVVVDGKCPHDRSESIQKPTNGDTVVVNKVALEQILDSYSDNVQCGDCAVPWRRLKCQKSLPKECLHILRGKLGIK